MPRSRAWVWALAALALVAAFALFRPGPAAAERLVLETGTGKHVLQVEVADDPASRERGLMYRKAMAPDAGMLFEFEDEQLVSMWMKDTYLPLDMLFISADGHIVDIARGAKPLSLDIISSDRPVRAVLEVLAGTADRLGVAPGARVIHPFFARNVAGGAED